jgi:hypothetical protein
MLVDQLTENDVLEVVRDYLRDHDGCAIENFCSTSDQGVDIIARARDGRRVYVEGKGCTSSKSHTARFGQPFSYGQHLSHVSRAVYTALKLRQEYPHDRIILAFPDVAAVVRHFEPCRAPLGTVAVEVALVNGDRQLRWLIASSE